jgi:hypothetical protein
MKFLLQFEQVLVVVYVVISPFEIHQQHLHIVFFLIQYLMLEKHPFVQRLYSLVNKWNSWSIFNWFTCWTMYNNRSFLTKTFFSFMYLSNKINKTFTRFWYKKWRTVRDCPSYENNRFFFSIKKNFFFFITLESVTLNSLNKYCGIL